MDQFSIEQALFGAEATRIVPLAFSPGFREEWKQPAEEMINGYGERPANMPCPLAVFAQPFAGDQVAVVQVADQAANVLAFHFLVMPRLDYERYLGDPFHLAQKLPADWQRRGPLPTHAWPRAPLPGRTIQEVREVLQRLKVHALSEDFEPPPANDDVTPGEVQVHPNVERTEANSESPALLGSTQVLVDGGKVMFRRPGPDTKLMQGLWTLLPTTTRNRLWPASFAFSNQLQFDAVVLPRLEASELEGYTSEEQAVDYPEGRYELSLQVAAETGDQDQLNSLLGRRSVGDTWRLGLYLLAAMIVLVIGTSLVDKLIPRATPPLPMTQLHRLRVMAATSIVGVGDPWTASAILLAGKVEK